MSVLAPGLVSISCYTSAVCNLHSFCPPTAWQIGASGTAFPPAYSLLDCHIQHQLLCTSPCQGTRSSQGSCRWDTAPASQSAGHSTTVGQDQQDCLLHPVFLSRFASWRILQSTHSNLAWNVLKRGILELDKASSETLLLQGTEVEKDELKQQSLQLHTQIHIPAQQRTLDI